MWLTSHFQSLPLVIQLIEENPSFPCLCHVCVNLCINNPYVIESNNRMGVQPLHDL